MQIKRANKGPSGREPRNDAFENDRPQPKIIASLFGPWPVSIQETGTPRPLPDLMLAFVRNVWTWPIPTGSRGAQSREAADPLGKRTELYSGKQTPLPDIRVLLEAEMLFAWHSSSGTSVDKSRGAS